MLKIKICGITNLLDAEAAVEAGADMLGFNFYPPSPRFIFPANCASIIAALRGTGVLTVGVFVNASLSDIRSIMGLCSLDLAQLSGDEPPELLEFLGERSYKALRPVDEKSLNLDLVRYRPREEPPAILLDAFHPQLFGGSGKVADWRLAKTIAGKLPILLAGGLKPENVAAAISEVRPWGVDVASGVELSPGKKDPQRMVTFIQAARQAASLGVNVERKNHQ